MRSSCIKYAIVVIGLQVIGLSDGLGNCFSSAKYAVVGRVYNHPKDAFLPQLSVPRYLQSFKGCNSPAIFGHFVVGLPVVGLSDALPLCFFTFAIITAIHPYCNCWSTSYWPIRRCMTTQGMRSAYTAYPSMKLSYLLLRLLFISPWTC